MPRRKKLTHRFIEDIARGVLENGAKGEKVPALRILQDELAEQEADKQTERQKVTKIVIDDEKLQEKIRWSPLWPKRHEDQIKVLQCKNDDIVICAGRQGGKTVLCAYIALKALLEEGKQIALIAPSYNLTDRVMNYLKQWIAIGFKNEMKVFNKIPQKITTKWGSQLDCWSADEPDQILGKGYDLRIVDECARIAEKINQTYIIPSSGVKIGKSLYISTPTGRDWFWRLWRKANEIGGAFKWPSYPNNPYFQKDKWDKEKKALPEFVFNQEYGAEFLESAVIFKGLDVCLKDYQFPEEYNENHIYVMGVDLGRHDDFTVVAVMDMMTNRLSNVFRFQGDWKLQKERITSISDKYGKCPIWIDATSITVGDAFVQELSDAGYHVTGYKINSNVPKRQLIEKLIVLIQNNSITLPIQGKTEDSDELITEHRAFTFEVTPGGVIRYLAPQGEHDDAVIALAFACFELEDKPLTELKKGQGEVYKLPDQTF